MDYTSRKIWAIVPAAGSASRFGGAISKQFIPVAGLPLIHHTLQRLCAHDGISGVWVGLPVADLHWRSQPFLHDKMRGTYTGGETRCETVRRGIEAILGAAGAMSGAVPDDWVLVHDAARPCLVQDDLSDLISHANANGVGAVLAQPVSDTLARADADLLISGQVKRSGCWRILTPQMFRLGGLKAALHAVCQSGEATTDESTAMLAAGIRAQLVHGRSANIKVTHQNDISLVAAFLKRHR